MSGIKQATVRSVLLSIIIFYVAIIYNACSEVQFQDVSVDNKTLRAPAVLIDNGADYTNNKVVHLTLEGGPLATEMLISNDPDCSTGEWEAYETSSPWTLADENKEVQVYVMYREDDGPETECVNDGIVHDNEAPQVMFASPQNQLTQKTTLLIRYKAFDALSGIKDLECARSDMGPFTACIEEVEFTSQEQGPQQLYVRATDHAKNRSPLQIYRWSLDNSPPTLMLTRAPGSITADPQTQFEFIGFDEFSKVVAYECKLDGQPNWQSCTSPMNFGVLKDGPHSFEVRVIDQAGNISLPTAHPWMIDSQAPTVEIIRGPEDISAENIARFEFRANDGNQTMTRFECRLDNGAFGACQSPKDYAQLTEGIHTFQVRGIDRAGNQSAVAQRSWLVDTLKPSIRFVQLPDPGSKTAEIQLAASDGTGSGIETIECRLDGGSYQSCPALITYPNLAEGRHEFVARAKDKAGNYSDPILHTWTIDTIKPTVTIVKTPDSVTNSAAAEFEFVVNDAGSGVDRIECRLNGGSYEACTNPKLYNGIPEGNHSFYVRAVDKVGLVSDPAVYSWLVDLTPPRINFVKVPPNLKLGMEAKILFLVEDTNGSGVENYACYYDNAVYNCAANQELSIPANTFGTFEFRVRAQDFAGNEGEQSIKWQVTPNLIAKETPFNVKENQPVDILFVVDTSGSMDYERSQLSSRLDGFLTKVNDLDWQIGIITTDPRSPSTGARERDGLLISLRGMLGYILDSSMDMSEAQSIFGQTVQGLARGSGDEQGIYTSIRAIDRALDPSSENQHNQKFFRDTAHLAVVLLSDEDEGSKGVAGRPTEYMDRVSSAWNGKKNHTWHSIVVRPGDKDCLKGEGYHEGHTYAELAQLTNGVIGSVCESDYSTQLKDIGQSVRDMHKTVTLACEPVDQDNDNQADVSVVYTATGSQQEVPFNEPYQLQGMKMVYNDFLPPGDYKFSYKCIEP